MVTGINYVGKSPDLIRWKTFIISVIIKMYDR